MFGSVNSTVPLGLNTLNSGTHVCKLVEHSIEYVAPIWPLSSQVGVPSGNVSPGRMIGAMRGDAATPCVSEKLWRPDSVEGRAGGLPPLPVVTLKMVDTPVLPPAERAMS